MNNEDKFKLVYFLNDESDKNMYINITNLCTNNCIFCIRDLNETVAGANLSLPDENISEEVLVEEIKKHSPESREEIIFCGYGEPLIKLEAIKHIAKFLKENYPGILIRINTNGHANLIHKRNVVPELVGLIDKISVSLNADNADLYEKITKCNFEAQQAFDAVKIFITECKNSGIDTTASVVTGFDGYKIDVDECRKIVEELGVNFKVRKWLDEGYK